MSESGESMVRTAWNLRAPALQTAVIEMTQRDGARRVTLVGMIHVGSREYYEGIQRLVDQHEAAGGAVLYEGVGSLSDAEVAELPARERAIYRALAPLHELYGAFAQSLDLVFQNDALHYDRERWINAD